MTQYRRHFRQGGSYFFTVNIADRSQPLLIRHIHDLRQAFISVRQQHPFTLDAIIILPDHLHTIWTLPPDDSDFSTRWKKIKAQFSRALPITAPVSASRQHKGERNVWQRRFWEHTLRDEMDYQRHLDYIHYNPVKHGYCSQVKDWPYSSFHRFVAAGIYPENWAGIINLKDPETSFGE